MKRRWRFGDNTAYRAKLAGFANGKPERYDDVPLIEAVPAGLVPRATAVPNSAAVYHVALVRQVARIPWGYFHRADVRARLGERRKGWSE